MSFDTDVVVVEVVVVVCNVGIDHDGPRCENCSFQKRDFFTTRPHIISSSKLTKN